MADRDMMRAADEDRQQVVDRLQAALEEGRLKLDEFTERVGQALQAVTYADLAKVHADLPAPGPGGQVAPAAPAPAPAPAGAAAGQVAERSAFAELPGALKVLWTIWGAAVSINIVVWVLVMVTTVNWVYPWPLWVAGPAGAALFGISAPVVHNRRLRRRNPPPPRPGPQAPPPAET